MDAAQDAESCLDFSWESFDMMLLYRKAGLMDDDSWRRHEAEDGDFGNMNGLCEPSDDGTYSVTARFKRGSTAAMRARLFDHKDEKLKDVGGFASAVGANDIVEIPDAEAAEVHLYPNFARQRGTVHKLADVRSPQLDNVRDIWVYLPPSHDANTAVNYSQVMIQWDGQTVADHLFRATLDAAILGGDMEPVVVVGISSIGEVRSNEMTPTHDAEDDEPGSDTGKGDLLIDFVLDTVLPLVTENFPRVQPAKGELGVAGYSLGGLMSAYALFTRRDDFNKGSLGSSSLWWDDEIMLKSILPAAIADRPVAGAGLRCWVDMGGAEGETMVPPTASVVEWLQEEAGMVMGEDLAYQLDEGAAHEANSFLRRLWQSATFMYPTGQPKLARATSAPAAKL